MTIDLNADHRAPPPGPCAAAHALRGLLGGRVHLPGDPGVRRGAAAVERRRRPAPGRRRRTARPPPRSPPSSALAAEAGLRVAPQSTGHNAGPLAAQGLDDVVIVRTSEMNTAIADPTRGIVRVEGGAIWEPAVDAAAAHGQAVLHGSSPDVGIAGYCLGGGIGWYARKLGLAANSLTAVEIVRRRRHAGARRRRHQRRALLGGARWRRQLRRRHRAGVQDVRHRDGVRRHAAVGPRGRRAGAARVGRLGADRSRRDHHVVPRDAPARRCPTCRRSCGAASWSSSTARSSARDERGAELLAGLRALRPSMDTFAPGPGQVAGAAAHGPRGRRAVRLRLARCSASFPDAAVDAFLGRGRPGRAPRRC